MWARDPFQNTVFVDFPSSGEIEMQFCNKLLIEFLAGIDEDFFALKRKAFRILLLFKEFYLYEIEFSAIVSLEIKYRPRKNQEIQLRMWIFSFKPAFEKHCCERRAHGSH